MIIVEISITAALMIASFHSSVPASHDIVTVSRREQHKDPETEADKWNSAFIVIFNACAIATVTCKNNKKTSVNKTQSQLFAYISIVELIACNCATSKTSSWFERLSHSSKLL